MSSSEDFIQRSLFSSLIGLRFRTPKFEHDQTPPSSSLSGSSRAHSSAPLPFNYDLPCSSKAATRQGDVQRQQIHCQYGNAVERDIEQRQQYTQQQGQQQQKPSIVQRRQDTVAIRQKQKQLDQCHIQQQQYHHEQPHQQQTDRMQFFQQNYDNNANENNYGMYENSPPPSATENISLSDQLSESLFLASPQPFDGSLAGTQLQTSPASATFEFESYGSQSHPQPQPQLHHGHIVASPHDIYQQIVNECEPFLDQRRHYQPNCHGSHPPFQLPYDGGFFTVGSYSPQPTFHPHTVASYKTESDVSGFADSFVESAVEALASEILTGIEPIQQQQRQQQQSPHQHQRHQTHPREKVCKKLTRHPKLDALLETLSPFGNLSLEEFVKIVVAAVRDRVAAAAVTAPPLQPQPATISAISPTPSPRPQPDSATTTASGETAEEILQRKRQQNNEAAARYRKRIRKARLIAEDEIEDLQRRNESLRAEIAAVGHEIDALKSKFVVAEQSPGDDKFDLKKCRQ